VAAKQITFGVWSLEEFGGIMEQKGSRGCGMTKLAKLKTARVLSDHALAGTWEDPEKKMWVPVRYNHPLIGSWQEAENSVLESSVVYKIAVVDGRFVVSGIDESDGTKLQIYGVRWDGTALRFTSLFPPTAHRAKHVLRVLRPGLVNHEVTYTSHEVWRKRAQKAPQS
jgi:hypothetical protein